MRVSHFCFKRRAFIDRPMLPLFFCSKIRSFKNRRQVSSQAPGGGPRQVLFSQSKCDCPNITKVMPKIIAIVGNSGIG